MTFLGQTVVIICRQGSLWSTHGYAYSATFVY